jgi:predicted transcriptional regulator
MEELVLSAVQSRILLALLLEGPLSSNRILRFVGISGSSWAKEKRFLVNFGLINSRVSRDLTERGVIRKMEFFLTKKGKQISQSLLMISDSIGSKLREQTTTIEEQVAPAVVA